MSAAASPATALDQLIDRVRAARAGRQVLNIHGARSKAFYGGPEAGTPLDVRPLAGISSYEPSELVVTVRAGTPLAELEAALAEQGQHLPFEPPHFGPGSTVGGMVAAGLAGPARASAGGVRDHLLGATLLNGRAEVLSFGGQVMKNVAGYDVSRLLAGSLGVLGVICEVSLKVLPLPVASATLRFDVDQPTALKHLNTWAGLALPLNASAWWSGTLVLRLAGAAAAVRAACQQLGGDVIEPSLAAGFWQGLRDQHDEFFTSAEAGTTLWRLSVPQTAPALPLPEDTLVEWGGAQRWVYSTQGAAVLRSVAAAAGGHATAFRGGAAGAVFTPLAGPLVRIHAALKDAFDPDQVFNPGRLFEAP